VASRAEHPRDDFTSDLLLARDADWPALTHQEVTQIELLFAGHETTTGLIARKARRPDFELPLARLNEQSRSVRDRAAMIRHEEGAMRTKADGDSSVRWGERFDPLPLLRGSTGGLSCLL
jgi:hypothetical protein